jgi:hypothetical protein
MLEPKLAVCRNEECMKLFKAYKNQAYCCERCYKKARRLYKQEYNRKYYQFYVKEG